MPIPDIWRRSRGENRSSSMGVVAELIPETGRRELWRAVVSELVCSMFRQKMHDFRQLRSRQILGAEQGILHRPNDSDPRIVPRDGDLILTVIELRAFVL